MPSYILFCNYQDVFILNCRCVFGFFLFFKLNLWFESCFRIFVILNIFRMCKYLLSRPRRL